MSIRNGSTLAVLVAVIGALLLTLSGDRETAPPGASPVVIFRSLAAGDEHGRLVMLGLSAGGVRRAAPLSCTRVHYAGGRGVCTVTEPSGSALAHVAYVFDRSLAPGVRIELDGVPTRMRVAPTGRVAVITTYENGPAENGVVTNSVVVDLRSGAVTADFREFEIDPVGAPPSARGAPVSGVAFERDGNRFFATLATDDEPLLVAGSLTERRMTALRTGVSNEALSPDGRRLVVKKLRPERGYWQLAVIDLATWQELELPQGPRSVDDQVEWLDNQHVMYHDVDGETMSLWILAADGGSAPSVLVKNAYSGSVQR
jgi:dipeptidyl aminopeptidase/acylaminoacyl peptidase